MKDQSQEKEHKTEKEFLDTFKILLKQPKDIIYRINNASYGMSLPECLSKYKAYLIEQGELHKVKRITFKFDHSDESIELRKKKLHEAQSYTWDWMHSVGFTLDCCSGLDFDDTFALMSDYKDHHLSDIEAEKAKYKEALEKLANQSDEMIDSPDSAGILRGIAEKALNPNSKEEK